MFRKEVGLVFAAVVFFSLLSCLASAEDLPVTIYDPLSKKNVPLWAMSDERLQELIDLKLAKVDKWSGISFESLKKLKGKIGYQQYRRKILEINVRNPEEIKKEKSLKEKIAEEFKIKTIYDPVRNINRPLYYLTTNELIDLLNNPTSQQMTFRGKKHEAKKKLKEMGLEKEYQSMERQSVFRKKKTFNSNHKMGPAPTYGLSTKLTKMKKTERTLGGKKRVGNYKTTYGENFLGELK